MPQGCARGKVDPYVTEQYVLISFDGCVDIGSGRASAAFADKHPRLENFAANNGLDAAQCLAFGSDDIKGFRAPFLSIGPGLNRKALMRFIEGIMDRPDVTFCTYAQLSDDLDRVGSPPHGAVARKTSALQAGQ